MADPRLTSVDVAIVGAGLAGSTCATALTGKGFSVALVDARTRHPPEFRAEKFSETEMALFTRYGLGEAAHSVATPLDEVWVGQGRRLLETARTQEYGFSYSDLINALRENLPDSVHRQVGRVEDIQRRDGLQRLALSDGSLIEARLVVVATGLGHGLHRLLGIPVACVFKSHSVTLGFTFDQPVGSFPFRHFTYRPVRLKDRVSYLTLFAIGDRMRANLFVYRDIGEAWIKDFRQAPVECLDQVFPDLRAFCGDLSVSGPVEARPMDLVHSMNPARKGIVLIGDAYRTTCPTAGAGMAKALIDVERLCDVHAPAWLAQPGVAVGSTASFYDDPVKQESDRRSVEASRELRSFMVETGLRCTARRLRSRVYRTGLDLVRRAGRTLQGQDASGPQILRGDLS